MNIFLLDIDTDKCAQYHCDKHVVKMVLESAQLLCSPYEPGTAPYKRTHYNHPCAIWVRESKANYNYLINLGLALCSEYTYRYNKVHKSQAVIEHCRDNMPNLPDLPFTWPPLCMPEEFKGLGTVKSYRRYYRSKLDKLPSVRYTKRDFPHWLEV